MYLDQCRYKEDYQPEHTYTFTGKCVFTGKEVSVVVKAQELFNLRQGAYIQDALVSNTAAEREFLLTGCSEEHWNKMFPKEDEVKGLEV